jgi:nucleotide-binding universal stress UspA family protein
MYNQILVPLDGSELSERALPHARDLAQAFKANLHLLRVISHIEEFDLIRASGDSFMVQEYAQETAERMLQSRRERAEAYLSQTADRLRSLGLEVRTALQEGAASENIEQYVAAHSIDLIVMSTHGQGGLRRFFTGSVTDRVLRSVGVPVLAVPPPAES